MTTLSLNSFRQIIERQIANFQQKDVIAKEIRKLFVPKTPELYTYDLDGNLLSDGKFNYTWDAENRLISVTTKHTNDTKLEFSYDYMGRRISKKSYSWDTDHWSLVTDHKFAWDGWNLIAEFTQSPSLQISKSYLWGEDIAGPAPRSFSAGGGVGGLLAVKDSSGTYLPCYDGNGNIVAYVDNAGNKVAEYEYDAFGRTILKAGVKADDMAFRFSTKWMDGETGDYYYGYRYYNPDTGRWLSRDPIDEYGGLNIYSTENNLVNKYDSLGLKIFVVRRPLTAFKDNSNDYLVGLAAGLVALNPALGKSGWSPLDFVESGLE